MTLILKYLRLNGWIHMFKNLLSWKRRFLNPFSVNLFDLILFCHFSQKLLHGVKYSRFVGVSKLLLPTGNID